MRQFGFVVAGRPATQGSMTARISNGRTVMHHGSKRLKRWREDIGWAAKDAMKRYGHKMFAHNCVDLVVRFFLRPADYKMGRMDLDKLARAVCDSLTGIAYADDSQVTALLSIKCSILGGGKEGLRAIVTILDEEFPQ